MFKKVILFITTILTAISASTGYGVLDVFKGTPHAATFLDWFKQTEKYLPGQGLILLDLIPALFLIVMAVLFFREGNKVKGSLTVLALILNLIGVFLVMQYAYPVGTQMAGWTAESVPSDWNNLKDEWMKYIGLYGLTGVLGWLCFLMTYFVPAARNTAIKPLPRFLNIFKNVILFLLMFSFGMSASRLYEFFFFPYTYDIAGITFIEIHQPLDAAIRKVGPIIFLFMSTLLGLLATLFFVERSKRKGWLVIGAFLFLLADTLIALQGNGPLNDLFQSLTPETIPGNWSALRDQWLQYHLYRDILLMLLFALLLLIHVRPEGKEAVQST